MTGGRLVVCKSTPITELTGEKEELVAEINAGEPVEEKLAMVLPAISTPVTFPAPEAVNGLSVTVKVLEALQIAPETNPKELFAVTIVLQVSRVSREESVTTIPVAVSEREEEMAEMVGAVVS